MTRLRLPKHLSGPISEPAHRRLTLLAMCVATFMILLDITIVNVALPRIQSGLHLSPDALEWVISGYALVLAAAIPGAGTLGDRYGRKRVFLAGMAVFTLGSLACALAGSAPALIAFRAVEALGGAVMLALSLSIITETFPAKSRAGAIGTWAAISGIGFGLGPVVGGVLLSFFDWPSVFWVNVPIGIGGIALVAAVVGESRDPESRRLDRAGVALSAAGLVGLTLGLVDASTHPWGSWSVITPLIAGAALLGGFVAWEHHTPFAMMPPALLRARSFVTASGVYLIMYAAQAGMLFYLTLLYQDVIGWSALRTGLSWLLLNVPFLLAAQSAGALNRRFSPRTRASLGCAVASGGLFALSSVGPTTPFIVTAIGYVVSGAGFGAVVPGITHEAMRDVPSGVSGAASGVFNASRQLGTSVGLALLGSIGVSAAVSAWTGIAAHLSTAVRAAALAQGQNVGAGRVAAVTRVLGPAYRHPAVTAFVHGCHVAMVVGAGCLLGACLLALFGFRARHRTPSAGAPPEMEIRDARALT